MKPSSDTAAIEELLARGVEKVYPSTDFLRSKLTKGERLTIYLGADPTAPSLHIGHMIPALKLRAFQQLGHKIIFLIGDFTATIGDPDKLSVREPLTHEQVLANAALYAEQMSKVLSFEGENAAEVKHNAEWLSKLSFADILNLTSKITHSQIVSRDMFQKRIAEGKELYLHEFLYPVMQGYDSLAMDVDGEVGGNDQTFNMLVGRDLLKKIKGKEKFVLTTKLLADSEGVKMGKTTGNMVALTDSSEDMFGKIMSWSDSMIVPGFELCTLVSQESIKKITEELESGINPIEKKRELAWHVVALFHSKEDADRALDRFQSVVQNKEIPEEIPEVSAQKGDLLGEIVLASGLTKSKGEFRRLVEEGAVSNLLTEETIKDPSETFAGAPLTLKIGKRRFLKIVLG